MLLSTVVLEETCNALANDFLVTMHTSDNHFGLIHSLQLLEKMMTKNNDLKCRYIDNA